MNERRNERGTPPNPSRGKEYHARSVDEAVLQALRDLGLGPNEVEVEIIKPGSRGLLGLLGEEAVVRVTPRPVPAAPVAPEADKAPARQPSRRASRPAEDQASAWAEPRQEPAAAEPSPAPAAPLATDDVARFGVEALHKLLRGMGVSAQVTTEAQTEEDAESAVVLNVTGSDLGVLIGRQGETLRDLQFVTSLIVSRQMQHWPNLVVDVEHYKSRRRKALVDLAKRMADRVRASGQPLPLEPMPPHERRFVHLALRDDPDVFTESTGQDDKRRVVIIPKK